jgi:hypothetical protein
MHRSSESHCAWLTPCRSVRLPGRTDPAAPPAFPEVKTNSETSVTIRIRRRAPLIVGPLPRQRYELCRKYRECRKVPADDGVACTWPSRRRAEGARIVVSVAVQATGLGRRRCRKEQRLQWLAGFPGEAHRTRSRSPFSSWRIALPRREQSLPCAWEIAAHPASAPRNFGNRIHCSSA